MKRTNLFKAMATILAVAMVLALVPMAAMAASTTEATITYADGKATVTGKIDADAELTMVVVRTAEEIESLDDVAVDPSVDDDTELENAIMYIDQVTATANTEKSWTFELRDTAEGNVLTAFVGGTDATVAMDNYVIPKAAPGITYTGEASVFDDQDIVFNVTGGSTEWANAATVYVNDEVYDNSSVAADSITLTGVTANVTAIKVVVAGYEDAAWAGTITVKNRMAVAKEAIENAKVAYDTDEGSEIAEGYATITLPEAVADANETGVAISYSLKKGEDEVAVIDRVATVARPDEGANADVYTVIATLTYGELTDTEENTVSVKANGDEAAKIDASAIELKGGAVVYGVAGAQIVIVRPEEGTLDYLNETIMIGDVSLYYAPWAGFYTGYLPAKYADSTAAAEVATIVDGPSPLVYHGKAAAASNISNPYNAVDAGGIKRILAGLDVMSKDTVKNFIASDIGNGVMDGTINAVDFGALKRILAGLDTELAINTAK